MKSKTWCTKGALFTVHLCLIFGSLMLSSIIISICVCTLLTLSWKVFNSLWLVPKRLEKALRAQGLKGNSYRFLFGDGKEMMNMVKEYQSKSFDQSSDDILPHATPYHDFCAKRLGKTYFMWLGTTPRLNIHDPKLIKDVFFQYTKFQKPKMNSLGKLLLTGVIAQEGDDWVKHRSLLSPSFHMENLRLMIPAMYDCCIEMISNWEELLAGKEWCEVNVQPDLIKLSADIISRTAFGSNFEQGKKIFLLLKEQSDLVIQLLTSIYIPGYRFLPTKANKRLKQIHREVEALLREITKSKEKMIMEGKEGNEDLLGKLVKTNMKEIEDQGNKKHTALSLEDIIDECKLFYTAGQETTSISLAWTLIMLGKHLTWQDRAREEIKAVFADNKPDFDGLNRLKVVTTIINEVLRLYPPVTAIIRYTPTKVKLGKYDLPAGTEISLPVLAIHTDCKIWGEDATQFNPERFSEGVAKATDKQTVFFPLGAGPRVCIGQNFTILEAKLSLAMILQRFYVQLSPSYVHAPSPSVTRVRPQHGVHVILKKII